MSRMYLQGALDLGARLCFKVVNNQGAELSLSRDGSLYIFPPGVQSTLGLEVFPTPEEFAVILAAHLTVADLNVPANKKASSLACATCRAGDHGNCASSLNEECPCCGLNVRNS